MTFDRPEVFFLVLLRMGGFFFAAPLFGSRAVPNRVKAGLALLMTLLLYPFVPQRAPVLMGSPSSLVTGLFGELLIGIVTGFMVTLVFEAVKLAGQVVGFQMGFGIVNILDPGSEAQYSILSQFKNLMALLLFLTLDGHHVLLKALAKSFEAISLLGFSFHDRTFDLLMRLTGEMFLLALKISAPVLAISLFTSVALGLVARTVPQINVFIVGFPLQIALGLIGLGFSFPFLAPVLRGAFERFSTDLWVLWG